MKRLFLWLLLTSVVLLLLVGFRLVSTREAALLSEEVQQRRAITYELLPQQSLQVALNASVDVIRIVARPFWHGIALAPQGNAALVLEIAGTKTLRELVTLPVPIAPDETRAEEGDISIGAAKTLYVNADGVGQGTLTLNLSSLAGAEGLLLRFYRRRALSPTGSNLDPNQQSTLLGARWTKVAPLSDSQHAPISRVLVLAATASDDASQDQTEPKDRALAVGEIIQFVRASPDQPVIVEADTTPLVLRVSARRPLRNGTDSAKLSLTSVTIDAHGTPVPHVVEQEVKRSPGDRYQGGPQAADTQDTVPSERMLLHLLVPAFGRVVLRPTEDVVDLTLSELDPRAAPRPAHREEDDTADSKADGAVPWRGFVPRLPSNIADFPPTTRGALISSNTAAATRTPSSSSQPTPAPVDTAPILARARVARPLNTPPLLHEGRSYVPASEILAVNVPSDGALLSLRVFSHEETDVVALIDDGAPRRRHSGNPRWVSVARSLHFKGDGNLSVVLGDDLTPGVHRVSLQYDRRASLWLHAPWAMQSGIDGQSAWVSGDLEP